MAARLAQDNYTSGSCKGGCSSSLGGVVLAGTDSAGGEDLAVNAAAATASIGGPPSASVIEWGWKKLERSTSTKASWWKIMLNSKLVVDDSILWTMECSVVQFVREWNNNENNALFYMKVLHSFTPCKLPSAQQEAHPRNPRQSTEASIMYASIISYMPPHQNLELNSRNVAPKLLFLVNCQYPHIKLNQGSIIYAL